jgi:hypothetical protein
MLAGVIRRRAEVLSGATNEYPLGTAGRMTILDLIQIMAVSMPERPTNGEDCKVLNEYRIVA